MTVEDLDPELTNSERQYHETIERTQSDGSLVKAALSIGAAFYGYRWYMQRQLKKEMENRPKTAKSLADAFSDVYSRYQNVWIRTITPHLISGYASGLIDVHNGALPERVLREIAYGYAWNLGDHINDVTAEAVVSGYQAQLNRKVPPARALNNVLVALGVPPKAMNSLVNVWTTETPKIESDVIPIDHKHARAKLIVDQELGRRASNVGENEIWSVREQAKQIVWMYGVETGNIPSSARRKWITADDERVCPTCGPMDGVEVFVDEKFSVPGYGKIWAPPIHPNCRCDLALDFDFAGQWLDDLSEGVYQEAVGKALGFDPYDRDKSGRFASYESRNPQVQVAAQYTPQTQQQQARRVPERVFEAIEHEDNLIVRLAMAEVLMDWMVTNDAAFTPEEYQRFEAAVTPEKTSQIEDMKPVETKLGLTDSKKTLGLTDPGTKKATSTLGLTDTKVSTSLGLKDNKGKLGLTDSASTVSSLGLKDTAKVEVTDKVGLTDTKKENSKKLKEDWDPFRLERMAWTYIDPGQIQPEKNLLGRRVVTTDSGNRWNYNPMTSVGTHDSLAQIVGNHWSNFKDNQLHEKWMNESDGLGYATIDSMFYEDDSEGGAIISEREFIEAFEWTLRGRRSEENRLVPLTYQVPGSVTHTSDIELTLADIADYYDFDTDIGENLPTLATTEYVDSSRQDFHTYGAGYAEISGRWVIEDKFTTTHQGESLDHGLYGINLPHRALHLKPEFMPDDY